MSNEIGLLAKVLQTNEEELKTKWSDENGVKEIETRIGNLKVFKSNEEFKMFKWLLIVKIFLVICTHSSNCQG